MCKACRSKVGSMSKKSKAFTIEDIVYAAGGAVLGLASNYVGKMVVDKLPANSQARKAAGFALPGAKVVGGTVVATKKKMSRAVRFMGAGFAAQGSIELAQKVVPGLKPIAGIGDLYTGIGSPSVDYPIGGDAVMEVEEGMPLFEQEALLGTYDEVIL